MPAHIHLALSAQGAGFASLVKNTGLLKYGAGQTTPAISVDEPQYVVTSVEDLSVRGDILSGSGSTYFQAQAALNAICPLIQKRPAICKSCRCTRWRHEQHAPLGRYHFLSLGAPRHRREPEQSGWRLAAEPRQIERAAIPQVQGGSAPNPVLPAAIAGADIRPGRCRRASIRAW